MIILGSCNKNKDKIAFEGTISNITPKAGDTLSGSSFNLQINASANQELHGWYYAVYDSLTLDLLQENQAHLHSKSLSINELININLTDTTTLKISCEFATDDAGNNLKKTIYCKWIP